MKLILGRKTSRLFFKVKEHWIIKNEVFALYNFMELSNIKTLQVLLPVCRNYIYYIYIKFMYEFNNY